MAIAWGERDTAKRSECRRDVSRGDFAVVFARLDAEAHQENRHVLVIVIRRTVARTVGPRFSRGRAVHQPVRLRDDKEITATSGKIAVRQGGANRVLCSRATLNFFRPKNS